MKSITFLFILITGLATDLYSQKAKPVRTPTAKNLFSATLDDRIRDAIAGFQGNVWIYAKNLDTSKEYSLRGDEQTRTASTIKLAIMATAFREVADGKIHWNDPLEITKEKKQG